MIGPPRGPEPATAFGRSQTEDCGRPVLGDPAAPGAAIHAVKLLKCARMPWMPAKDGRDGQDPKTVQ
jgi:hypothetical protein